MGKGDKKTRRGKVTNGSYGKTRMRKASVPLYDKVESATEDKKEEKKVVAKKKTAPKKVAEPKAEKVEKKAKEEKTETSEEKEA